MTSQSVDKDDGDQERAKDSKSSDPKEKKSKIGTKVVLRCLPPSLTEGEVLEALTPVPENDYVRFVGPDLSLGYEATCRIYFGLKTSEAMVEFRDRFDGYVFVDTKSGLEYVAIAEQALNPRIPKRRRRDPRCGTIGKDEAYVKFVESLENPEKPEMLSLEARLAELELRDKQDSKSQPTPLLEFVKKRREDRIRKREERKRQDAERRRQRDEERKKRLDEEARRAKDEKKSRSKNADSDRSSSTRFLKDAKVKPASVKSGEKEIAKEQRHENGDVSGFWSEERPAKNVRPAKSTKAKEKATEPPASSEVQSGESAPALSKAKEKTSDKLPSRPAKHSRATVGPGRGPQRATAEGRQREEEERLAERQLEDRFDAEFDEEQTAARRAVGGVGRGRAKRTFYSSSARHDYDRMPGGSRGGPRGDGPARRSRGDYRGAASDKPRGRGRHPFYPPAQRRDTRRYED